MCCGSGMQDAVQSWGSLISLPSVIHDNFSAVQNIFSTLGSKNIGVEVGEEQKR